MSKDIDDPRREFLVRALTLGVFAAPNFASLLQPVFARGDIPDLLPSGRSIYKLEGSVTVDGQVASIDTPISAGSRIQTGARSRVIFIVANDAFILRSNSSLELDSGDGAIIAGMRLIAGKLLSVFGKREKPHTITSSTATIGIRGTGIYVESEPEQSYVCTCYGTTRLRAAADPGVTRDIVSEHHDSPVYILRSAADSNLIVPAPFINHTDTELSLIEALVGRTPPYAYVGGGYEVPRKRTY